MDYEKKYKEALERARQFSEHPLQEDSDSIVEYIFPELNESEDEKIRKELIDYHRSMAAQADDYVHEAWIAWLEKQKEYESTDFEYVWDRTDCGALTSALDKYSKEAIINMCHAWYDKGIELERKSWLEKQGEQKPTIEMITSGESLGIDSETYNKIVDECIYGEKKSQRMISAEAKEAMYDKPAWSEKDEQHIDSLLKRLDGLCRNEFERTRFAISEDRDWLTSLKERIE